MNRQRRIFTATLALISLIGEISNFSPAAAASHYPLWVCAGRYGGWGWSRPAGPFGNLTFGTFASAMANPMIARTRTMYLLPWRQALLSRPPFRQVPIPSN